MRRLLHLPIDRPWPTLVIVLVASIAASSFLRGLVLDNRTENILPAENERVRDFERFRERFGTDEMILVGFGVPEGERILDSEPFEVLEELTRRMEAIPEVEEEGVLSLANIQLPAGPFLAMTPLASPPPTDERSSDLLADRVRSIPLLSGTLISDDHATTAVLAVLRPLDDEREVQGQQIRAVGATREIVRELAERTGYEFHVAGTPTTKSDFVNLLGRDMLTFVPISTVLIGLVLLALFRSSLGLFLPLMTVALAIVWTLAAIAATGRAINTVTSLLPPLILAMGCADTIHILTAWASARRRSTEDQRGAVREAIDETFMPCLLTTVTTMAGFLSLTVSPIAPIRDFGIFAAFGSLAALVLSMSLVPAALSAFPSRTPRIEPSAGTGRVERFCGALGQTVVDRPRSALLLGGLLAGTMITLAAARLEVEVDFLSYFKRDHDLSRAVRFFSERLSGPAPLELVVDGPPGSIREPTTLRRLARFQERLEDLRLDDHRGETFDPIDRAVSIADFVRLAHQIEGGDGSIPDDMKRIEAYEFFGRLARGGRGMNRLVTEEMESARISARMQNIGSQESLLLIEAIEREFEETFGDDPRFTLTVTGSAVIFLEVSQAITVSQLRSFGLAVGFVFATILVLFRSPRIALISLVPNLFPITITFGLMALFGITLNLSTAMVASIAIGIAVDDTIHFLAAFQRESRRSGRVGAPIVETCRRVGAACASTSLILCVGFGVSILASFYPTIHFGALSAATIGAAFIGDFLVLPALIRLCWPRADDS